jgi:hypothetical protein
VGKNLNTPLKPREAKFIAEYLKDSNGSRAAIASGYSGNSAAQEAYRLLHENPGVMAAIAEARKGLKELGIYNLEKAMKEADDVIAFAKETENANAYAKAFELKAKLNGLLVEKHDVRTSGFVLQISGIGKTPPAPIAKTEEGTEVLPAEESNQEVTNLAVQRSLSFMKAMRSFAGLWDQSVLQSPLRVLSRS